MKDYYKILGVDKSVNAIAIKKAYRKLALELHPDINKSLNAHNDFVELNEAYHVLHNHTKRKQYDRLYDYNILNQQPKDQYRHQQKYQKWQTNVDDTARKGKEKGEKYATESGRKFKRRVHWWDTFIIFELILEGLWWIIEVILSIL